MGRLRSVLAVLLATLCLALAPFASAQPVDPEAVLRAIAETRTTELRTARESGRPIDTAALAAKTRKMAEDAIKGVDPKTADLTKAMPWASLFEQAGQPRQAREILVRFIAGNPPAEPLFDAWMRMASLSIGIDDHEVVHQALTAAEPVTAVQKMTFAQAVTAVYAGEVAGRLGFEKGDALFKKAEVVANTIDADDLAENLRPRYTAMMAGLKGSRVEFLKDAGKKDEAIALAREVLADPNLPAPTRRSIQANLTQMQMVGAPAPGLAVEAQHGAFPGLEAWRGRVVIVDFFAHWCGPCKASLPSLRKLYDDLHSKGLEIVHVTRTYGYFGQEGLPNRDLPRETEIERMKGFMAEHGIIWPVIFTNTAAYEAYGVTGIPHVALVDKQGRVVRMKVGFSQATWGEFRKAVEALLNE